MNVLIYCILQTINRQKSFSINPEKEKRQKKSYANHTCHIFADVKVCKNFPIKPKYMRKLKLGINIGTKVNIYTYRILQIFGNTKNKA